jgi:outer membrane protein assembly factor BamB
MSRSRLRRIPALSATVASAVLLALAPDGLAPALRAAESADPTVDWPQFRGGSQTGMSPEKGLLHSWPEGGPKVVWKQAIGEGFSAVNAVGGFLYTMAADGDKETALCLEEATGKLVWRTPVDAKFVEEFGNGPRSTPAVAGGRVHALSSNGKLVALQAKNGAKVWEVDIVAAFGSKVPTRGFSPSIVVDGDLVLLEVGGKEPGKAVAAFDAATGKVRWTALDGRPGYTTPLAVTIDGVRQYVFVTSAGGEIVALRPDGQVHWRHAWSPGALASALFVPPNRIFASAADDVGSVLVEVTKADGKPVVKEVWKNRVMKNHFSSSVLVDGHIYGFDNASLKCVDPATGEQKWVQRGFGKGSLIAADGLLFVLSDRGALVLVEATPEAYREKGRTQALEGKTWTAPSLARGKLYLRDHDELVVLDVKGTPSVAQPNPVGR